MKRFFRGVAAACILFFMISTYASAALLAIFGFGVVRAYRENPEVTEDYTGTKAFRRVTGEYFDALYEAVAETGVLQLPYDDNIAYFAFGLEKNYVCCSDPEIYDIPSFEEKYLSSRAFVFTCRYSADTFRGTRAVSGAIADYEYDSVDAADEVFDGVQRNYPDTAIILAVRRPEQSLTGYGYSRIESFMLNEGVTYLFVLLGTFLTSFAIVLSGGKMKQRIDRVLSDIVAWVWLELKLAVLVLAAWLLTLKVTFPIDYDSLFWLLLIPIPLIYLLRCNVKYAGLNFFRRSLICDLVALVSRLIDEVLPVMPPQLRLRRRLAALAIFGLALPLALFFLTDALLGLNAVRLMIPFYIVYFAALSVWYLRRYIGLVNDVCELTRLAKSISLGEQMPEYIPNPDSDIAELARSVYAVDEAVNASADMMFKRAYKRLSGLSSTLNEMRDHIKSVDAIVHSTDGGAGTASAEELAIHTRRMQQLADDMLGLVMQSSPVSKPVLKRTDLLAILDEAINARLAELSAARISINAKLPNPPAFITADPMHIRSALDIIFGNLALYALSGSPVELELRKDDRRWRFSLVNAISPSVMADSSSMNFSTGLSQAREYIALNGGLLEYTAEGGRFGVSFVLPEAH